MYHRVSNDTFIAKEDILFYINLIDARLLHIVIPHYDSTKNVALYSSCYSGNVALNYLQKFFVFLFKIDLTSRTHVSFCCSNFLCTTVYILNQSENVVFFFSHILVVFVMYNRGWNQALQYSEWSLVTFLFTVRDSLSTQNLFWKFNFDSKHLKPDGWTILLNTSVLFFY